MQTLKEYQIELKTLYDRLAELRSQGKQGDQEYQQAFVQMSKTFQVIKEFERIQKEEGWRKEEHDSGNDLLRRTQGIIALRSMELDDSSNEHRQSGAQPPQGPNFAESQLYQLGHQIQALNDFQASEGPLANPHFQGVDMTLLKDRVGQLHPETWKMRRDMIMAQTQKIYEENIKSNPLITSHDLLGFIDRKLSNPFSQGEVFIDMSKSFTDQISEEKNNGGLLSSQPFELEQILNINKIDQALHIQKKLEAYIEQNDFKDENEAEIAHQNLKCLKLYQFQQELRSEILHNQIYNLHSAKPSIDNIRGQTLGDIMYTRQLVDREFYKRTKTFTQNKKEARTLDRFEQNMRTGQETRKKTRHREFLAEILQHAKDFHEFHRKKQTQAKRKGQIFKNTLESRLKREIKNNTLQDIKRRQLLRDNKFDDWLKLINFEKNQRLMEILNQTNKYIEELGEKVSVQKNEVTRVQRGNKGKANISKQDSGNSSDEMEEAGNNVPKEEDDEYDMANMDETDQIKYNLKNSSNTYYKITHSIQDEVKSQPEMLKGGQMKSYQIDGLNWMVSLYNNNLNGILADEMGLGKTIQTIALFAHLIEVKKNPGPFLVVVPLTTINNWWMEFEKWAPEIKIIIYKGKKSDRQELAQELKNEKFNVLITTYEYIMLDKTNLKSVTWQYIIVDEGHRMKNQKSKFAMTLGTQYSSAHRILLTGTPLQNNLSELWALLNFLLPKIFSSCEDFQKWFDKALNKSYAVGNKQITDEEREAMELSEEEQLLIINRLHQILRPFLLRRVKKDVAADLPQKIEMVIKVELSALQKIVYKGIQENNQLMIDPSKPNPRATSLKNAIMQLRKICNHPYLFNGHEPDGFISDNIFQVSGKFELLDRMLPKLIKTNHKILIFSQFTQLLDIMQKYFYYRGIPHLILDGRTKNDDRKDRLNRFQDPNSIEKVFVLSTKAGGHGLNLQVSDTVIIFDSDWNPQMDEQAKDRAHRIGQMHEVRVFRLITATNVEEGILFKATYKKALDNKIIQAGMFNNEASDLDRQKKLEELIRYDDEDQDEEMDKEAEIPTDEQINVMIARSPEELELFNQMDREMYERENKESRVQEIMKHRPGLKDYNRINYRLVQEWEVPEWVKVKPVSKDEEAAKIFGLGKRERKEFINYDNLSEQQFLKYIEEGKDPQEVVRQAALRREKRRRDGGQSGNQFEDYDINGDSNDDSAEEYKGGTSGPNSTKRRKKEEGSAKQPVEQSSTSQFQQQNANQEPLVKIDVDEAYQNESQAVAAEKEANEAGQIQENKPDGRE